MRKRATIGLIAAAIALSACATNGASKAPRNPPTTTVSEVDQIRMARVEARARGLGVDVIWVNPPQLKH
jgi:LmbE family N-acetylglucosaminyl deacetylase